MAVLKQIGFDEATDLLVKKINSHNEKSPFIISIHGYPDAGKTELTRRIHDLMAKNKKYGISAKCNWPKKYFPHISAPKYFLIEDLAKKFSSINYAQKIYKKTPDLSVFIAQSYAPKDFPVKILKEYRLEGYDLFIVNPAARIK